MTVRTADTGTVAGVRLTHPDKVLYPEQGITKQDLADYYLAAADRMLPHVTKRPLTLVRCPAGSERKCFYQRHAGSGVPDELGQVPIAGFAEPYLYIKDTAGLIALVQMGVLEIHPWGARIDRPDRPDRIVFDLDPGEGLDFAAVVAAALDVRERLEASASPPSPRRRAARACMWSCRSRAGTPGKRSRPSPRRPPRRWRPARPRAS